MRVAQRVLAFKITKKEKHMLSSLKSTSPEAEPVTVKGFLVEGKRFYGVDSGDAIAQYVRQHGDHHGRHGCKVVEDRAAKSFIAIWDSELHCYLDVENSEYRSLDQDAKTQLGHLTCRFDDLCRQRSKLAEKVRLGVSISEGYGRRWQSEAELQGLRNELTESRQYLLDSGTEPTDPKVVDLDEKLEPIDTKLARIQASRDELVSVEAQITSISEQIKRV